MKELEQLVPSNIKGVLSKIQENFQIGLQIGEKNIKDKSDLNSKLGKMENNYRLACEKWKVTKDRLHHAEKEVKRARENIETLKELRKIDMSRKFENSRNDGVREEDVKETEMSMDTVYFPDKVHLMPSIPASDVPSLNFREFCPNVQDYVV